MNIDILKCHKLAESFFICASTFGAYLLLEQLDPKCGLLHHGTILPFSYVKAHHFCLISIL